MFLYDGKYTVKMPNPDILLILNCLNELSV